VVHVLAVESTRYTDTLATTDDAILVGCLCAACGSTDLTLTQRWVDRGLQTSAGYGRLLVRLARCCSCGARERVLPCDALPGKVNSVDNIFSALGEVQKGRVVEHVAHEHGVSRQAIGKWAAGAAARYLDLAVLYRHRAMLAAPKADQHRLLVRWWAFIAETRRRAGQTDLSPPRHAELASG